MTRGAGNFKVPGEGGDNTLNNAGQGSANDDAAEQEELTRQRVEQARQEEEARTQANQAMSQQRGRVAEQEGAVVIGQVRRADIGEYGPEVNFPQGTLLVAEKGAHCFHQAEGAEQATHVVGRVLTAKGWLVQRAVPLAELDKLRAEGKF